jgi:Zn-dependent protease with chaperone function
VNAAADRTPALAAELFDGSSARPSSVTLRVEGDMLRIDGNGNGDSGGHGDAGGVARRVPLRAVRWPERTRHGARVAHFQDGGSVQALDAGDWDAWARASGIGESAVVTAQQSWRATGMAVVLLVALAGAGYLWGVPWLARGVLALLPVSIDKAIGEAALGSIDATLLGPSKTPEARQRELRNAFERALAKSRPGGAGGAGGAGAAHQLIFRGSPAGVRPGRSPLGPNAFALPGGTIVVTDDMLELLAGRDDVLIGVLGHEFGHVQRRHGMRLLVQATVIGTAAGIAVGDFSSVLAAAPALLGQSAYSRDFEREADADAIALLRADGLSPAVMIELFDRLAARRSTGEERGTPDLGIALASHPADAERVARFRDAAAR